jgi:hypothetical protein
MTDVPTTSPLASLERRDAVFVLHLGHGENRLDGPWLGAVDGLDWLGAHAEAIPAFSEGMQRRYAPVLDALVAPVAA